MSQVNKEVAELSMENRPLNNDDTSRSVTSFEAPMQSDKETVPNIQPSD